MELNKFLKKQFIIECYVSMPTKIIKFQGQISETCEIIRTSKYYVLFYQEVYNRNELSFIGCTLSDLKNAFII